MTIRFNDGMAIGTDGDPRIIRKDDGLYVVGNGTLCAVRTYSEGWELVQEMKARMAKEAQVSGEGFTYDPAGNATNFGVNYEADPKPTQSAFEFLNDKLKAAVETAFKDRRTEEELIKEAWRAQDACNVSGLVLSFAEAMKRLAAIGEEKGVTHTKWRNCHLVVQLMLIQYGGVMSAAVSGRNMIR